MHSFRSRLSVAPLMKVRCLQDPVIFSGTVRHNLDPIGRVASDADLWAAVRSAGLLETIQSLQVRYVDCQLQPDMISKPTVEVRSSLALLLKKVALQHGPASRRWLLRIIHATPVAASCNASSQGISPAPQAKPVNFR